jgi:hypothetical protein
MFWYVIQRITGREGVEADTAARRAASCGHCTGCDETADPERPDRFR